MFRGKYFENLEMHISIYHLVLCTVHLFILIIFHALCSGRSSSHRSTVLRGTESRDTFAFTQSTEERILQTPQPSRKKRHEDSRTAEGASRDSRPDSHITDTSLPEQSHGDKSKKKKKKNKIADEE